MNPPVQNNSSLIALAFIEDQERTVESPVFAHPDNPDISVCSNGNPFVLPNPTHLIPNPLHTGSINSPTHLHLSQTHLGTQTEPFAYSVGQSPASTTRGSTKLAKAHLIEAAKKNTGVFEFSSKRSLQSVHQAALTNHIGEGMRLHRTIIGQLLREHLENGKQPIDVGDGYTLTDIRWSPQSTPHSNHQEFMIVLEREGQVQQVVFTLYHSTQFDGRAMPAEDIYEANKLLTNHQQKQASLSRDSANGIPKGELNDQILSTMGIGRSAAVAVLNVFESEICNSPNLDEINVSAKIDEIINKGREQVSPLFIHTKIQRLELIRAAERILNEFKTQMPNTRTKDNSSPEWSDDSKGNQIESSNDSTPIQNLEESLQTDTLTPHPQERNTKTTYQSTLVLKTDRPYFDTPRDPNLSIEHFGNPANKMNAQMDNRCYISALNDIYMLNDEVNGIREAEILLFQVTEMRKAFESAYAEMERANPFMPPEYASSEETMTLLTAHQYQNEAAALHTVHQRFSIEPEKHSTLIDIFPDDLTRENLTDAHKTLSADWIRDNELDALTLCLAYKELSQQVKEICRASPHPYWLSLPDSADHLKLTSPSLKKRFTDCLRTACSSTDPHVIKPRNMILMFHNHAAHAIRLDNNQWLVTDYTQQRPHNDPDTILSYRYNPQSNQLYPESVKGVLLDSEFVHAFLLEENARAQAVH